MTVKFSTRKFKFYRQGCLRHMSTLMQQPKKCHGFIMVLNCLNGLLWSNNSAELIKVSIQETNINKFHYWVFVLPISCFCAVAWTTAAQKLSNRRANSRWPTDWPNNPQHCPVLGFPLQKFLCWKCSYFILRNKAYLKHWLYWRKCVLVQKPRRAVERTVEQPRKVIKLNSRFSISPSLTFA